MARNRVRARLTFCATANGEDAKMSRPARAKTRRLSVLVVAIRTQGRAVQRARLCAITCTAKKRPDGVVQSEHRT